MYSAISQVLRSVLAWTLSVPALAAAGLWLGLGVSLGEPVPPESALLVFVISFFACLVFPQLLIAWGTSFTVLVVGLATESGKVKIAAATANFLAWFSMPFCIGPIP